MRDGANLTNFDVTLARLFQPTDDSPIVLELAITLGTRQQLLRVPYDCLDQLDLQKVVPGCVYLKRGAKSEVARQIRLAVAQALQEMQVGTLFTQSGWYKQASGNVFIAGGAVISGKGIAAPTDALISDRVAQLHLAIDNALSPDQACELLLRDLIYARYYAIPAFSYTLYGALYSIWPEAKLPTACVLNILGTQGYGKTTMAKNLCALYDDSAGRVADFYDAQSTPASMRNALIAARDRIVVVDDLCKSTSSREMQKRRDLTASLLRSAANESPVSKLNGNIPVSATCTGGLVLTGELPLETPSDITRCIIIDMDYPMRNGNPDIRAIAATAVAHYLQWLCVHFQGEMDRLANDYRIFSEKDAEKHLWRLKKSIFQLDWAFNSFLRFAKSIDVIDDASLRTLERMSGDVFQIIFSYEEALVHRLENTKPANWLHLIMEGAKKGSFQYVRKSDCLCITTSDLTNYLRTALHKSTLQEQEIIRALKDQDLLLMDKSGKSTKKVSGVRMLNIKLLS